MASTKKLRDALAGWDCDEMLAHKAKRARWLESEVEYIKGMIRNATREALPPESRILAIGAGPFDVLDYWPDAERHAIDPLAKAYKEKFHEFQDPAVKYIEGVGENLPYEDNYFDVVIIRNALDHLDDPYQSLRESFRVLKPTGALYIWIYLYGRRASLMYRLINALTKRYEVEPWAFTLGRIKKCLSVTGFIPYMTVVEERPVPHTSAENLSGWLRVKHILKKVVKKMLCLSSHNKGFRCVALPDKGVYRPWVEGL